MGVKHKLGVVGKGILYSLSPKNSSSLCKRCRA